MSGERRYWDDRPHILGSESEDKRGGTAKGKDYGGISRNRSFTAIFNLRRARLVGNDPGGNTGRAGAQH